jgi:hypothetical protein
MAAQTPQPQQYSPLLKQKKGCSDRQGEAPKRFVDILAEELKEIEQLRQNREWKDPAKEAPQPPAGGPDPTTNPAAAYPAPAAAGQPHEDPKDPDAIISRAHGLGLVGLAFSGGGIRSATFNLGVLQALADFDLLKRFDYLSTVSGGGYIGSWLTAWIRRRTLDEVVRGLQTNRTPNRNHWEVEQIRFLREYSNYLTPRLGFLSLDTWAMIATYVRNTLLNLTILVLALASILLLPHAAVAVGALARAADPMHSWTLVCAGVLLYMIVQFMAVNTASKVFTPGNDERFACFTDPVYARVAGAAMLPAAWCLSTWLSGFPESPAGSSGLKWAERVGPVHVTFGAIVGSGWLEWAERGALTYFLLWLVTRIVGLVAELVSAAAADPVKRVIEPSLRLLLCITHKAESPPKSVVKFHEWWERHPRVPIYLCHALTVVMGSVLLAIVWTITFPYHDWVSAHIPNRWVIITPGVLTAIFFIIVWMSRRRDVSKRRWEFLEFFGMLFATPFAGAVGGVLLGGLIAVFNGLAGRNWGPLHVFVLGTPLVVAVLLVVATLHVGLMGLMLSNQKREWWSRLGGWVAVLAIGWVVVCGLSLYGWPVPDAYKSTTWEHLVKWGLTPAWILSTVGGVLGGKSKATGDDKNPWVERAVGIAPYIFVVGLLEVVSYSLSGVLAKLDGVSWAPCGLKALIATGASCAPCYGCVPPAPWRYTVVWLGIVAAALLLVALFLAWRVDVNDFSMHLFYRNRLVRCYLGASLGTRRKPHPFTGFDPNDDIFLKYLRAEPCPGDPNDDIFLKDLLAKPYSGPFPILNASLNLVKGNELAWQERKAESFSVELRL